MSTATATTHKLLLDNENDVPVHIPVHVFDAWKGNLNHLGGFLTEHRVADDGLNFPNDASVIPSSSLWDIGVQLSPPGGHIVRPSPAERHQLLPSLRPELFPACLSPGVVA